MDDSKNIQIQIQLWNIKEEVKSEKKERKQFWTTYMLQNSLCNQWSSAKVPMDSNSLRTNHLFGLIIIQIILKIARHCTYETVAYVIKDNS